MLAVAIAEFFDRFLAKAGKVPVITGDATRLALDDCSLHCLVAYNP